MATTTTSFPTLSVPAEDTMEVSSPANQTHDTDIDLDFGDGDYDGGVTLQEDEQMLTDTEQARPATATDDMMDDDLQAPEPHVQEADMHDTPDVEDHEPPQEDEELIDYGDDEYFDQQQTEDITLVNAAADLDGMLEHPGEDVEQVDEEIVRNPEDAGVEQTAALNVTVFAGYEEDVGGSEPAHDASADEVHPGTDDVARQQQQHSVPVDEPSAYPVGAGTDEFATTAESGELHDPSSVIEAPTEQAGLSVDTTAYAAPVEAPGTPTDTGLHPMTVYYGEYSMPLFKSKHQLDGLLKDDNLASLSLHELLRNCRLRLALKTGNDLSEDQELTLAFDRMGLMLVENSRAAFEHSLNDVLDVYLQLHHNDGAEDIPPLSLSLTHQQFSNQLSVLKQAVQAGRGMSDFVPRNEEDEVEEEYHEEDEQETYGEDNGGDVAHGDPEEQQQEHYDQEGVESAQETEQLTEPHTAEEHGDGEQYHEEDYTGQEYTEDQRHEDEQAYETVTEQHEAPVDQAAHHQADEASAQTDLAAQADDAGAAFDVETQAPGQDQTAATADPAAPVEDVEDAEVQKAASTASSETVQGDPPKDSPGEYDEELIDWDDDSSLTSVQSELPADGRDDFSTFLTEYEDGEAKALHEHNEGETAVEQAAGDAAQYAGDEYGGEQATYLGSEDFLNDLDGQQQHTADDAGQGDDYQGGHDGDYEDDNNDQADIFDEQQNGEDFYQPGEDDEQFHTAHDFLNGESYEHGPEHQPDGEVDDVTGEDDTADAHQEPAKDPPDQYAEGEVVDLGDDIINFDDETTEQHEARQKASPGDNKINDPGSPLGKRSFDEHAEDELEFDDEEPELKKVRTE